jgi:hypothetical protein
MTSLRHFVPKATAEPLHPRSGSCLCQFYRAVIVMILAAGMNPSLKARVSEWVNRSQSRFRAQQDRLADASEPSRLPKSNRKRVNCLFVFRSAPLALALVTSQVATAAPNDYIRLPTVEYGEKEIDFKSGAQRNRDGSSEAASSIGYGFTPTTWWFTELYAKFQRSGGDPTQFDAWEWENRFQLTETGQYPVDVGLLLEIERPKNRAEGYEITYGPMFQSEWGLVQGNFNVFLQQHVNATERFDTQLLYQFQLKYRHAEQLEWGVQGFGNLGQWDHWASGSEQQLKVGPALFGKIKTGSNQAIKWNTALLVGTTNATPRTTLRLQVEYEF